MIKANGGIQHLSTGIRGFDEITGGGLPAGRVTVVIGGPGSGKTIFGLQALSARIKTMGEAGIFVAFEESAVQIVDNTRGFTWSLVAPRIRKKVEVLDARLPQSVVQGGEFDLIGLLAILGARVRATRSKWIILDGLDVLLASLGDPALARREIFRIREWLDEMPITAIITAKGDATEGTLSADYDFLQFMADCVVRMQHRCVAGTALRFIRVSKCRGSAHSANEFPFTIGDAGIEVGVGADVEMSHPASTGRVSTGIERLDAMLEGGYYRGSSTLITGTPGTAKTTLAAAFVESASRRQERSLLISFDEAPAQIVRNVESVGIRLAPHVHAGTLLMCSLRSRAASPEAHAAHIRHLLRKHGARNLVVDPISALGLAADNVAQRAATEILDTAKSQSITSLFTSLLGNKAALSEETPIGISTIADTWMHLTYMNQGGERNRALTVVKSRGTGHSNQIRELVLSKAGPTLTDVYAAGGEVLMGTLRWERENLESRKRESAMREGDLRRREAELTLAESKARTQAAHSVQAVHEAALERILAEREAVLGRSTTESRELLRRRGADALRLGRRTRRRSPR